MDKITVDTYNRLAGEYDKETQDFWKQFPSTFFDRFAQLAQGNALDVGSGPGRDALLLQERGLRVICLDASQKMVEMCQRKGLKAMLGDFEKLPFEDGAFDAVWAYTSLLHIPKSNMPGAIEEIRRVLKENGILGLGMIEGETEEYRKSAGVDKPRLFSYYTREEIEDLLDRHGFSVEYFEQFSPKTKNYLNFIAKKTTRSS